MSILNRYDCVLVPSAFNREVFAASGVSSPVYVVPHLAAETLHSTAPREPGDDAARRAGDGFVFYVIGTWTTRKALADVVSAYLTAFSIQDEVTLLIHTPPEDRIAGERLGYSSVEPHPARASTWYALAGLISSRRYPPRIVLSNDALVADDVRRLHARGDCFVCLSRGEGWGLNTFEAGAAGNPVIVTGWGGSLDFVPDRYPYLVDYDLVPTNSDEPDEWWHPRPGEHWAKADIARAAELMRDVFEHPDEARAWGRTLRAYILERFSAPVVTGQLLAALEATNSVAGRSAEDEATGASSDGSVNALNLGCGDDIRKGWINHDLWRHRDEVDVAHDLRCIPWPWDDCSASEIRLIDVLEHLPDVLAAVDECWRILVSCGQLHVQVPHYESESAWLDPTHVRGFHEDSFDYFDPTTPLGKRYHFYTPRKWKLEAKRVVDGNVVVTMRKRANW